MEAKASDSQQRRRPRTVSRWVESPNFRTVALKPLVGNRVVWVTAGPGIAMVIMLIAWLVHATGGTQYSYPYLILLPVILAGILFKVPGGLLAALLAALLLGPYMPLDVEGGIAQTTKNWLVRLGMYLAIGAFAGGLASILDFLHRRAIAMERAAPTTGLLLPGAAGRLAARTMSAGSMRDGPPHAVAIDFDIHQGVVSAMGIDLGNAMLCCIGDALMALEDRDVLVARIHGATFGLLVPGGGGDIAEELENWCNQIPRIVWIAGVPLTALPRFGVAQLDAPELQAGEPFRKALTALHVSRDDGQRVTRYNDLHDAESRDNLVMLSEFRTDLEDGLCEVHFQPKMSLASHRVFGAEALIRWNSSKRGSIPPGRFVPLVERTLLVDDMTRFVLDRSLKTLIDWQGRGYEVDIAINISMRNLEDEAFVEFLIDLPAAHGVSPRCVELEITETALVHGLQSARRSLQRLRDAGFVIAIDDFGTGYSSLSYLKELPIDWVKLDQSFVRDLPNNSESREICAATVAMCQKIGYQVIAEGVENIDALRFLEDLGYDAVQGYHLAKPMAATAFSDWIGGATVGVRNR